MYSIEWMTVLLRAAHDAGRSVQTDPVSSGHCTLEDNWFMFAVTLYYVWLLTRAGVTLYLGRVRPCMTHKLPLLPLLTRCHGCHWVGAGWADTADNFTFRLSSVPPVCSSWVFWPADQCTLVQGGDTRREEVLSKVLVDISIHTTSHASDTAQN